MRGLFVRRRVVALVALLVLAAGLALVTLRGPEQVQVTARFASAVGVYPGSDVRLMGVPIGEITSVTPEGDHVRVEMKIDASYPLPADARALVISPSVVADRFVQLAPTYSGSGPKLTDGAMIPLERTGVPVELDRVYEASHDLMTALGPKGANSDGALSRSLRVGAKNLDGQGTSMRDMIRQLSGAMTTLGATGDEFFSAVDSLDKFSSVLARDDRHVSEFYRQMASISSFLSGERDDLQAMLGSLAVALGTVETFVKDNRELFVRNIRGLARLTTTLAKQRAALVEITEIVPLGLNNLNMAYDPVAQAVRTRNNTSQSLRNLANVLCDALEDNGVPDPAAACLSLRKELLGVTG